jgi:small subunit ribosomal protein S17
MGERKSPRTKVGTVLGEKMDKTVVVVVTRRVKHPLYKKYLNRKRKFKAHDAKNECQVGDKVLIAESRPLSKDKRWRVLKRLEKAV